MRIHRYDPNDEYEDFPLREPASRGRGTKHFTDLLGPLVKFLQSNVGRPWDKVYSELCAHLDRRKTTGRHVFEHLEQYVEVNCFVGDNGKIYARQNSYGIRLIGSDASINYYVDPRNGLLRKEKFRVSPAIIAYRDRKDRNTIERKPISLHQSYVRINGIWYIGDYVPCEDKAPPYELRLAPQLPRDQKARLDDLGIAYWNGKVWMELVSKRKCTQQELQAAGMQNVPRKK